MISRRPWPCAVALSLSFVACGGAVGGDVTPAAEPDAGSAASSDAGVVVDAAKAGSETRDAGRVTPSSGVVWAHAEASSFDPRACSSPTGSDFVALGDYLTTQAEHTGLKGASVNAGAGVCAFGSMPTTMSEGYVFAGTVAAAQALVATPPAPFHGTYVTVPLVLKQALNMRFEVFVGDGTVHAFDDVWVHEGLDIDGEAAFLADICNKKTSFDTAIATSPAGASVKAWLAARSADAGYQLGYDATFTFVDGTTTKIPNAHQAVGGPYLAPCPNLVASP